MNTLRIALLLALVVACGPQAALAQGDMSRFEVTPFAGYRFGGNFESTTTDTRLEINDSNAFGLLMNGYVKPDGQWEVLYSRQETDIDTQQIFITDSSVSVDVEYIQAGGVYLFEGERVRPFVAMTIGLSRFAPKQSDYETENFFAASLGAGVNLNANKRVGVRLEARAFTTLLDSNSDIFCESNAGAGSCLIRVDSKSLTQWQLHAGVVFRF